MSTDVSRIYQFLANDEIWQQKADANNDGTIIKSEFRNYMEQNFEWDGENASAKNDLINAFWKEVDTIVSGNVKGSKLKNKNALDSKEMDKINNKLEIYEKLNEYLSTLEAPAEVNNAAQWKKSVSESLGNYTETFIKKGGKADDLAAYLDQYKTLVENKTTADLCAQEYIEEVMGEIEGYKVADDSTLQGIINNYIKNLPKDINPAEIKQTVMDIIDAYRAVSGLSDSEDQELLKKYGYSPNSNSPLNDLQKALVEKQLNTIKNEIKSEPNYDENKELYDAALTEFIKTTLDSAKFKDFEALTKYGISEFRASANYRTVTNVIQTKGIFNGKELNEAIKKNINSSVAELIEKDGKYLKVMEDIEASTLEKVKNGDFNKDDGTLDTAKVIDYIVSQIQSNLIEFYGGNLKNMSIDELNQVYDSLVKAADKETDRDKSLKMKQDAAIKYCEALSSKSTKFAEEITNIFEGKNYRTAINEMYPNQIEEKISAIKLKVAELGDPKDLKLADGTDWGTDGNVMVRQDGTKSFKITPVFTDKNGASKLVTSDRVKFKSSNTSIANVDPSSGEVTVNGSTPGKYSVTLSIVVDGVTVGTKDVVINVEKAMDLSTTKAELPGAFDGNGVQALHGFTKKDGAGTLRLMMIDGVNGLIDKIYQSLKDSNEFDLEQLDKARTTLKNFYAAAIHKITGFTNDKSIDDRSVTFSYTDANGQNHTETKSYSKIKGHSNNATASDAQGKTQGISHDNSFGIVVAEATEGKDEHTAFVNISVVMELFQRFYNSL